LLLLLLLLLYFSSWRFGGFSLHRRSSWHQLERPGPAVGPHNKLAWSHDHELTNTRSTVVC
jgi:hypothetical protein